MELTDCVTEWYEIDVFENANQIDSIIEHGGRDRHGMTVSHSAVVT